MPIAFQCTCGRKFRTADENAGRPATCPDCHTKLIVPAASAAPMPASAPAMPPPLPDDDPPAARPTGYDVQSEEVAPVARRPGYPASGDRPRRDYDSGRRRPNYGRDDIRDRIMKRPPPRSSNLWSEGGILKGLGMMLLGVLITVGGLAVGWIIFPGPILFIVGIIAFVKGLASGKM